MSVPISLTQSATLRVSKNSTVFSADGSIASSTFGSVANKIQNIGTSAELVNFGDITGIPVMLLVKHSDTSNFVELALDSGMTQKFAKIYPGRFAVFAPLSATIYARASTAAVRVMVFAVGA